jgi:hypothetical protein
VRRIKKWLAFDQTVLAFLPAGMEGGGNYSSPYVIARPRYQKHLTWELNSISPSISHMSVCTCI